MKQVININFQGRVIPIEEPAFRILQEYMESLRHYFSREPGRDEILYDIEARIGELFSARLHKGAPCITDADVNEVIADMGRPADFEEAGGGMEATEGEESVQSQEGNEGSGAADAAGALLRNGKFYRNADDRVLGGVASGLANYAGLDPIILRILFVVLSGILFWVYIVLWIVVPSRSQQSRITKRLYRNRDQQMLGGVCSGIASYFHIEPWIPRLIFLLPLVLGVAAGGIRIMFWDLGMLPGALSGSFGWTMFLAYIILWIAVPPAVTAAEKLEMKGEKVDLQSIANSIKEDLGQLKSRSGEWKAGVQQRAREAGEAAGKMGQAIGRESAEVVRRHRPGRFLVMFLKLVLVLILVMLVVMLFAGFMAGSLAIVPLRAFILDGSFQEGLAWTTLVLLFLVPLVALLTWAIRRMAGIRSRRHYLGMSFGLLWVLGVTSGIVLAVLIARNFQTGHRLPEREWTLVQPSDRLELDLVRGGQHNRRLLHEMFRQPQDVFDFSFDKDSLMIASVRIFMAMSPDSAYHLYRSITARGVNRSRAEAVAEALHYEPVRADSVILLPRGFFIGSSTKYRGQVVDIIIEVPAGRTIYFGPGIGQLYWNEWDPRWAPPGRPEGYYFRPKPDRVYRMDTDGRPRELFVDETRTI